MSVKITYEFIKESFNNEGYTLVSNEYINNHTKLDYRCPKGHEHSIILNAWQHGNRCPTCSNKVKLTIDKIKKYFEEYGYVLLSKEYINAFNKLEYQCPNGHTHSIKWNKWQQERRCPTCKNIKFSGIGNPNWSGGISYEPYCPIWKDKEYKSDIKERDGNKCLNPACTKKYSGLTIHHIDYNKKNCSPRNLITICRSCNGMANKDRDWHTTWYSAIIKNRYYSRSA